MLINNLERLFKVGDIDDYFDFSSGTPSFRALFKDERFKCRQNNEEYDFPILFKMLVLQQLFDMGSAQLLYTIADRKSWMAFLRMSDPGEIPGLEAFEEFRQRVLKSGLGYELFSQFDRTLAGNGIVLHEGRAGELSAIAVDRSGGDQPALSDLSGTSRISEVYHPGIPHPIKLRTDTTDLKVLREVFIQKGYDFSISGDPEFILDCGANIGMASIYFKSRFPKAYIVAVEPEESNYSLLQSNLSYYYPYVECLRCGIWNTSTELSIKNPNAGNWAFIVGETQSREEDSIPSITINEILKRYNRDSIDILKVDIEGAERELFNDNYEYWLPRTKVIMIETHDQVKKGCSRSFFRAISDFNFSMSQQIGNTLMCVRDDDPN